MSNTALILCSILQRRACARHLQGAEADASFWFDNSGSTPPLGIADIFNDPADYQTAVSAL